MNKKEQALRMVERVVHIKVEENSHRKPPSCMGVLHQPKRPTKKI